MSTDHIDQQMAELKEIKKSIDQERQTIAAEAERFGQRLLDARRELGIPDPDGKAWGLRMVQYQIGLRALAIGMQEENFTIPDVTIRLRRWLTNPINDQPATDNDLEMLVELVREREKMVAA